MIKLWSNLPWKDFTGQTLLWCESGTVMAVLSTAAFSLKAIFVKLAYDGGAIDPIALSAIRMILSLPFFLWLSRGSGPILVRDRRALGLLFVTGGMSYLSIIFDFIGLQSISAGLERLILLSCPMLVVILEAAWRRRPIGHRMIACMALTSSGIFVAFFHDLRVEGDRTALALGVGWVFLSALAYSFYYMGSAILVGSLTAKQLAGSASIVATVVIAGHFLATHPLAMLATLPPAIWGWSAALALLSTALPIWLLAEAVQKVGAGRSAAISTLGPALTVMVGWVVLAEPVSLLQLMGVGLVIGGVGGLGRSKAEP